MRFSLHFSFQITKDTIRRSILSFVLCHLHRAIILQTQDLTRIRIHPIHIRRDLRPHRLIGQFRPTILIRAVNGDRIVQLAILLITDHRPAVILERTGIDLSHKLRLTVTIDQPIIQPIRRRKLWAFSFIEIASIRSAHIASK